MENKFYITAYWQSLDLIKSELDRDTCDFVYERTGGAPHPRPRREADYFCYDITPAWSMARMWEMLYSSGLTFDFSTEMSPQGVINALVEALKRYAKEIKTK